MIKKSLIDFGQDLEIPALVCNYVCLFVCSFVLYVLSSNHQFHLF